MSAITLRNSTDHIAQFTVKKDEQILARIPGVASGQSVVVPVSDCYEVVASTMIDGNLYYSAPMSITGATGFLAQVIQERQMGTYVFDVLEVGSTMPNQLQFQTTWREQVTFTIWRDGVPLQDVICRDAFNRMVVNLGETFRFQAVINGITTATQSTTNPNVTCTAVEDTTLGYSGYYTLLLDGARSDMFLQRDLLTPLEAPGRQLSFDLQTQVASQWSWAAVTASIASYFGQDHFTQCKLAQWSFGAGGCNCCSSPLPEECNQPFSVHDSLAYVGNLSEWTDGMIAFEALTREIDAGNPVVAIIEWDNMDIKHPVLVTGYSQNHLTVQDPGMGSTTIMAYDQFPARYKSGATWHATATTRPKAA